jgi:hypothetical protein
VRHSHTRRTALRLTVIRHDPAAGRATSRLALGTVVCARSGDKGGSANIGLWTKTAEAFSWLEAYLTVGRQRELLPEAGSLEVQRYLLPELNAMNFVVVGLLGEGVASSTRPDPKAKGLGELDVGFDIGDSQAKVVRFELAVM